MEKECEACGQPFAVAPRVGRPSQFCSSDCRAFATALTQLKHRLGKVRERCTDAAFKTIRGELWSLANSRGVNDRTGVDSSIGSAP